MGLILDGIKFELNTNTRETAFFVETENGKVTKYGYDISFRPGDFHGEKISPGLIVNDIKINIKDINKLKNKTFFTFTIIKSLLRENLFIVWEAEPIIRCRIKVMEIKNDKAHLKGRGRVYTDTSVKPRKKANFKLDCWLPVITDVKDWEKFGL